MKLGQWIGFFCLMVSLIILWQVRDMLLLVFAAVVLASALNSLVNRLEKMGVRRSVAVPIVLGGMLLLSIVFIGLIVPPFIDQFTELLRLIPRAFTRATSSIEAWLDRKPAWFPELELPEYSDLFQQFQPLAQDFAQRLFAFFSNSLAVLLQILFVLILTLMMLANPLAYRHAFLQLFPSFYRRRADGILRQSEIALDNWMAGLIVSSSAVAVLSASGLLALRVKFVLAHALLAGLLNFIPNIGPTMSLVFPLMVAFLDAPWKAIGVIILYIFIQNAESYYITPTIMQQQVSLLPAITLVAQIFFATFFGFLGLLLALPLTVVAKIWIQEALVKDVLDQWQGEQSLVLNATEAIALPAPPTNTPTLAAASEESHAAVAEVTTDEG